VANEESGWTLYHTGRIVFAFRSLKPPTRASDPWPDKSSLTDRHFYKKTACILEVAEAPETTGRKSEEIPKSELGKFHQTLLRAKTLKPDAAIYPIPADGEGIGITGHPILATCPEDKNAPRILHQKDELLWLDREGTPALKYDFTGFLK
jgi:hypothetical protein